MQAGETPGDHEDRAGEPFVGPAGSEMRAALKLAGIDAESVYMTNAVEHFKWRPRGKRRLRLREREERSRARAEPAADLRLLTYPRAARQ